MTKHNRTNSSASSKPVAKPKRNQNILRLALYAVSVLIVLFLLINITLLVTVNTIAHSLHTTYDSISASGNLNNMLLTAERMNQTGLMNFMSPNPHFAKTIEQEKFNFDVDLEKYRTQKRQSQSELLDQQFQLFYQALLTVGKETEGQQPSTAFAQYRGQVVPHYTALIETLNRQISLVSSEETNDLANRAIIQVQRLQTFHWLSVFFLPIVAIAFILYFGYFLKKRLLIPISTLGETSQQLTTISNALYESVNESSSALAQITASSEEYRATAASVAQSTLSIKNHVDQTVSEAEEATRLSKEAQAHATELSQLTLYFSKLINQEQFANQEVNELSKKLSDIANETHVLAINASIEAATAGAQGERFQVIANEVRYLAKEETTTSKEVQKFAQQIANNINNLQQIHDSAKPATAANLQQAKETKELNIRILERMADIQKRLEEIAVNSEQQEFAVSNLVEGLHELQKILAGQASQREKTLHIIASINRTIEQLSHVVGIESTKPVTKT